MNESLIHVGNLPYSMNREDLEAMFLNAGTVVSASLPLHQCDNRPMGFGFVEMATPEEASKAVEMFDGREIRERNLAVCLARHAVTHTLCLSSLWDVVLELAPPDRLASLRTVIVAGEACPPELVERHAAVLPDAELFNEYGPTEGTVWATVRDCLASTSRARCGPCCARTRTCCWSVRRGIRRPRAWRSRAPSPATAS